MAVGEWNLKVSVGKLPQRVATAMGKLNEDLVGAEYTPIAYLGSQVVNGTNHAVLAEQLQITGKDRKNVVIIVFNEQPGVIDLTVVSIEHVIDSGEEFGGVVVDVQTDIEGEARKVYDEVFRDRVGLDIDLIAYLGSQVVNGVNYFYAAKVTNVVAEPVPVVALVVINPTTKQLDIIDILSKKVDDILGAKVGYAFTWR